MTLVRSLFVAATVAAAAAVPTLSFAQTDHAITRAEVRAELVQLQQAGYRPASDNTQYPANLQAALARIADGQQGATTAYGGAQDGSSAAGTRVPQAQAARTPQALGAQPDVVGLEPIYAHS